MVDAVKSVGGASTVAAYSAPSAGASTIADVASAEADLAKQNSANLGSSGSSSSSALGSQKQFIDSQTGVFVIEQVDSKGSLISQTPGGVSLAYLRNGLTSDGLPKQTLTA